MPFAHISWYLDKQKLIDEMLTKIINYKRKWKEQAMCLNYIQGTKGSQGGTSDEF